MTDAARETDNGPPLASSSTARDESARRMSDDSEVERMLDTLRDIKDGGTERDSHGRTEKSETDASDWEAYLPFEEAYPSQAEGIEQVIDTGLDDGYTVIEGACGSGKTLLSLLAGISLVRDPDSKYERVFVVTSVKQQLQQFEADLRAINRERAPNTDPVTGVTLVGKTEMCPYTYEDESSITPENVSGRCADLREATRERVASTDPRTMVERAERGSPKLSMEGVRAPYAKDVRGNTCAFYAKYLAAKNDEDGAFPLDFADGEEYVADPATIRRVATEHGFCPHSLMAELHHDAEVVIGNYYHVFSHGARAMTEPIIGDETFLVVDEAHMVEERVRDLFERSVSIGRLETGIGEIDQVLAEIDDDGPVAESNRAEFEESGFGVEELRETKAFLRWIRERVDTRIQRKLERAHGDWQSSWNELPESVEIELRDPRNPGPDELTKWSDFAGYSETDWKRVKQLGAGVEEYLTPEDGHEEVTVVLPGVGETLERWYDCDHTRYFREIELRRSLQPKADVREWDDVYNGRLVLANCLPTADIAAHLDEFGGGLLMSATLEPLSVFRDVVGLSELDRTVTELTYPLRFPEENRESLVVETTQFTRKQKAKRDVRDEYAQVIEAVAESPGNVLICMPSYAEASWAASVLENAGVDKPVLVDESATNAETQRLKERFFMPGGKVLVTSARGTLTEGVDYAGDHLSAALVCSVPFVAIGPRARAIVAAYEDAFGDVHESDTLVSQPEANASGDDVGFEYAMTVPAVRKARQALGRVIRGPDERGVRVLADERYASSARWNSAHEFLSASERAEFERVSPDALDRRLDEFWRE